LLQERCYERVGETTTRSSDVRILAATNRDLEPDVAEGRFRADLLYRLNVIEVTLPPLRDRPADLLGLADHLLAFFSAQLGKRLTGFARDATDALLHYSWPGNIRELRNAIERAAILASGPLVSASDLPSRANHTVSASPCLGGRRTLDEIEAEHIRLILANTATLDEAAEVLGIDASTLYRKRKRYGL
jgi:NtrC-family two-component system response regulator AlgB